MIGIKTYIANLTAPVVAGATATPAMRINNYSRNCQILSIYWGCLVRDVTNDRIIPWEELNTLQGELVAFFGAPVAQLFGEPFVSVLPPAPTVQRLIYMYKPGQLHFKGVYFSETLEIQNNFTNLDLIVDYAFWSSIVIEIEELEK